MGPLDEQVGVVVYVSTCHANANRCHLRQDNSDGGQYCGARMRRRAIARRGGLLCEGGEQQYSTKSLPPCNLVAALLTSLKAIQMHHIT